MSRLSAASELANAVNEFLWAHENSELRDDMHYQNLADQFIAWEESKIYGYNDFVRTTVTCGWCHNRHPIEGVVTCRHRANAEELRQVDNAIYSLSRMLKSMNRGTNA